MEDYKFLIYIALSIVFYLFKNLGKKKPAVTRKKPAKREQQPTSDNRPKSFEEILAELTAEKRSEPVAAETVPTNISTEEVEEQNNPFPESYEQADDTLKELYEKGEKLKTLNELVDIDKIPTKSKFAAYDEVNRENELAQEIRSNLQNPQDARKAFIYSEIFNRKY